MDLGLSCARGMMMPNTKSAASRPSCTWESQMARKHLQRLFWVTACKLNYTPCVSTTYIKLQQGSEAFFQATSLPKIPHAFLTCPVRHGYHTLVYGLSLKAFQGSRPTPAIITSHVSSQHVLPLPAQSSTRC